VGQALRRGLRGHVRIDALYGTFSPFVRAIFDLVALLCLAALVIALADRAWELVADNLQGWNRSNTPLRVPLPYPQLPWFFGFALFLLAIAIAALRALLALVRGDYAKVAATVGVPSLDEEVKGERKVSASSPRLLLGRPDSCSAPPCSFSSSC
jgi:TRAP-type C4-dicarboxylate transport system permease small subunit